VTVTRGYDVGRATLWARIGHPGRLAGNVAMLAAFDAPAHLTVGSPVWERHTILGWPQSYRGRISRYEEGVSWAMWSSPMGWSPCPLPHAVIYRVAPQAPDRTNLSVTCTYTCGGVLAWPFVPRLVRWYMRRTILRLLSSMN
jgi:hypothetical protein